MTTLNLTGAMQVLETLVRIRNRMVRRLEILRTRVQEVEDDIGDHTDILSVVDVQIEEVRGLIAQYQAEAKKND